MSVSPCSIRFGKQNMERKNWLSDVLSRSLSIIFKNWICSRYTVFIGCVFAYSLIVNYSGGMGGFLLRVSTGEIIVKWEYYEFFLLLYLYGYFNCILRPSRWQALVAALPIFLAYLGQDIYYIMYSSVFRLAVLASFSELLQVLTAKLLCMLFLVVVLPLGIFFYSIDLKKFRTIIVGIVPIVLLVGAAEYFPESYVRIYSKIGSEIIYWSDSMSVENNGRFMMLLFREAELRTAQHKTKQFRNRPVYAQKAAEMATWVEDRGNGRNIHLIVLESFMNPHLLHGATFSKDPVHPDFYELFGDSVGLSLSPVFGGRTSQAEFEALCGAPAFEELVGVEFNSFTGAPAYCLPWTLEQAGYRTIASNSFNPGFFNTSSAYKGIGFGEIYFPQEFVGKANSYLVTGDTTDEMGFIFDRELFEQNLNFITPIIEQKQKKPVFNYLLTVYGHVPHLMNAQKRPMVLKMFSKFEDQWLERSANQFYYRTQAVAEYVNKLRRLDPSSLIIIVSDHLPPGQFGKASYEKLSYLDNTPDSVHKNLVMIIENNKVKKYATIHHYDIPAIILNYLSDGQYCSNHQCGFAENRLIDDKDSRHDDYMEVMAHASE